jgi:hypothetical protein
MSITARLLAFLAAVLVGAFVTAYKYHGAAIDAWLHTSHLHVMDWVLLLFGSLIVGALAYSLLTQPDNFDWRGGFWLVMGAFMIYAALGNNASLKETACRVLSSRHHNWSSPCYYE